MKRKYWAVRGMAFFMTGILLTSGCGMPKTLESVLKNKVKDAIVNLVPDQDGYQAASGNAEDAKDPDDEVVSSGDDVTSGADASPDDADSQGENKSKKKNNYNKDLIKVGRQDGISLTLGCDYYEIEDYSEMFRVCQDAEGKSELICSVDWDEDKKVLTINPPSCGVGIVNNYNSDTRGLSGSYLSESNEGAWGNFQQYYLFVGVDLETGEKLAAPEMTVVHMVPEISKTPNLLFNPTENGKARFTWEPVEGATEYLFVKILYYFDSDSLNGYHDATICGRTSDCEWTCAVTPHPFKPGSKWEEMYLGGALYMNDLFCDYYQSEDDKLSENYQEIETEDISEYYYGIIAVNENGASCLSNLYDAGSLSHMLPHKKATNANNQDDSSNNSFFSVAELPATSNIVMCDGTIAQRVIDYDFDGALWDEEADYVQIQATMDKTEFGWGVRIRKSDDKDAMLAQMEEIRKRQEKLKNKGGNVEVQITIDEQDVTVPDEEPSESSEEYEEPSESSEEYEEPSESSEEYEEPSESSEEYEEPSESSEEYEEPSESSEEYEEPSESSEEYEEPSESSEEYEEPSEEPETPEVPEVSQEGKITANSELSKYIAEHMMNREDVIDVSGFPEAVDNTYLVDAVLEAKYQNPLIVGMKNVTKDSQGKLHITYDDEKSVFFDKQSQIKAKVDQVVSQIITPGMTDMEKEIAINQYLCDTAEYNHDALDNAAQHNYTYVDPMYNDSFTPYGILIDGKGVCAGYAASFKLLADACGLESIVVTGYLEGNLAHAWNKVKIDGEWMVIDTTNNDNEILPNALFNLSNDTSYSILTEDKNYIMDSYISNYNANTDEKEYYRYSGRYFEREQMPDRLAELLSANNTATLRTDIKLDDTGFNEIAQATVDKTKGSLRGFYWLGVISLQKE